MTTTKTQTKPIGWIVAAAAAAVFALDLMTPAGIAVPMLYGIPLLMTWFVPGLWSTFLIMSIAMALTWGGTALSSGELTAAVAVNRTMASALLLVIGWLVIKRKRLAKQRDADQAALRESEKRFRLIADAAPVLIWIAGPDKRCTYFNQGWLDFTGRSLEQEIGDGWTEGVHPDDYERCLKTYVAAFDHPKQFTMEYRLRRADGRYGWIVDQGVPLWGDDGQFRGYIGACVDITDREEVETKLRESEERFRTMAQAVLSFLFETDAAGWNVWTSEGWCKFTGQTPEQVAGHGWAEALHPDDAAANIDHWTQCIKDGVPFEAQQRLRRSDGVYVWVIARALPVRDSQGKVTRWVGLVTNVDDIVRAQEALRESEDRFVKAFRASPNPIGITEVATGRCIEVNEACLQLFGFCREEVIGNTTLMLGIWPNQEDRTRLIERLKAGEPVRNLELSFKTNSGELRHILVSSDLTELGGTLCLITIGNDITDRKLAETALRESEERLQLFIEHAPSALAMFDRNMRYLAVSRRWMDDYGLGDRPLIGRSHYDVFPEIRDRWKEVHQRGLAGEVVREEADCFERADGSVQWLRWEVRPWRVSDGQVGGIVIFTEDITERKAASEALREINETLERRVKERTAALAEANERWGWVVRATHDAIWDWDLVRDTAYFSPRWKEMHGFQKHDALESTNEWRMRIHPEDRPSILASLEAYLRGEQAEFWEEYRIQRKDGTYIWVLDRGIAIFNEQGRAVRMVGAETDITWRKGIEEALRVREQQYHTLADNVPALFGYIDQDRRYQFVNRRYEELFGLPNEELRGMAVQDVLGPDGYAQVEPFLAQALAGNAESFDYTVKVPGEGTHSFAAQYMPDWNEQEQVLGVFVLMADVTTLKSTEALLREREAQLRELGAKLLRAQEEERRRISRDLHDDVMQRMGALALELYGLASTTSSQDEGLQSQLKAFGASAELLTTDLQRMAHQLHPSVLEFGGLETALREQVNEFGSRTGISAEFIAKDVPKDIPLDQATCLYRIVQEGLQNVQKHAEATTVLVRLLRTDRGLGLSIHDDGRGVENVDGATQRKGLGLTSMAERVGMLKGVFRIRAKPGKGTELHAWVPLEER